MEASLKGRLLLVGEGDFTFSVALMSRCCFPGNQVVATSLESEETIHKHELAAVNMQRLKDEGVQVYFEVDATDLQSCGALQVTEDTKFSRIIFNFPHSGGKSNHKKNRALLNNFFASSVKVLTPEGQIMVTLCKGQGGTPADRPKREWHDSWQIVSMAANASLILKQVAPFNVDDYPEYNSVGFRSRDKGFNTEGALTHIFEVSESVPVPDNLSDGSVNILGTSFPCPRYLEHKLNRKLLYSPHHPLRQLRIRIEETMSETLNAQAHHLDNSSLVKQGQGPRTADTTCSLERNWLMEMFPRPYTLRGPGSSKEEESEEVKEKDETETPPSGDVNLDNPELSALESVWSTSGDGLHLRSSALEELPALASVLSDSGVACHMVSCDVYGQRPIGCPFPVGHEMILVSRNTNLDKTVWEVSRSLQKATNFYFDKSPINAGAAIETDFGDVHVTHHVVVVEDKDDDGTICGCVLNWVDPDSDTKILAVLLNLNQIAQTVHDIRQAFLFWSTASHFKKQFMDNDKSLVKFVPFSVYPMKYFHDLSFWANPDVEFHEQQFHDIIRNVTGDAVTGVRLIDSYHDDTSDRDSRCYRMTFQSHDLALSYITSWKLQSMLRLEVAKKMGVCLR